MARFVTQSAHAGVTAIDNAFIIDYMPTAPDGAVKAYIYGLMAAGRGDAPDIADALGMDDAQLCDAFAYWQRLGLVRIASGEPLIVEFLKTESIAPAERTRRYASLIERLSKAVPGRVFTGSELSAICDWIEVFGFSEETAALLQSAMTYSAATGGLFDVTVAPLVSLWGITTDSPRVPSQSEIDALLPLVGSGHIHMDGNAVTLDSGCAVDLGGIAKGYASDRVAQVLRQYAVTGAAVSLGGNVYVCGQKSDGSAWSVAVQDPKDTGAYAMTLELTDVFAVTSGGYQRYFTDSDGTVYQHILDPRTGRPAQTDLLSVTVIGQNGTMADAYSTALYVMGEQAACDFWRDSGGAFDLVLITADGRVLYTPGLADSISQKGADYDFQEVSA